MFSIMFRIMYVMLMQSLSYKTDMLHLILLFEYLNHICCIIITKLFIHHQIMATSEIMSAKPEKFNGNNFRRWQN